MSIMTFDDGSTLDTDLAGTAGAATQSPPGYLLTDYSANFQPSNASPGAKSWSDVLAYGFGRLVDYKVASIQAQNVAPQLAAQNIGPTPVGPGAVGGVSMGTVLILGAVGLALVLALGGNGKG